MLLSRSGHQIQFEVNQDIVQEILELKKSIGEAFPKFGILILTYNAKDFIERTIDRIPKELESVISEIFLFFK